MLVMMGDEQILSAQQVCQNCLMATQQGLPRWNHGKLSCGKALREATDKHPKIYECQMGFHLTQVH
ncbi:MAG: hypothetical protein Tsb0014_07530 [Pleurocapsa sp.]